MNSIHGVEFEQCRRNLIEVEFDGIPVPVINLADLKTNKKASGRPGDMDDLQHLP